MPSQTAATVFSIGYEKQTVESLFSALRRNGIKVLFDVRLIPLSRKKGFSKTALAKECDKRGIEYRHNKWLGTPKGLLEKKQLQCGYDDEILRAYREHLLGQPEALAAVTSCAQEAATCLLCLEADPTNCHRSVIVAEMTKRSRLTVHHL